MTSPDSALTYSSFCGTLLDDMLDQVIYNIISRSLLNEKLIRKDYGTIEKPIFHDSPLFSAKYNGEAKGDDFSANGKKDSDINGNVNKRIDLTSDDGETPPPTSSRSGTNKNESPVEPDIGRFQFTLNGKDVYVNALSDNRKLLGAKANAIVVGTAQDTYFKCSNCDRKIAGSRFSAHIDKCFGGRSRK